MKHIIGFSGGIQSAYTAYIVSQQQKKDDIVLLFHDTKTEYCDSYRFRHEVSEFLGIPILEYSDGRDIWELMDDENMLANNRVPFCSRKLKAEMGYKYFKELDKQGIEWLFYVGYNYTEWRRSQKLYSRYNSIKTGWGDKLRFPLLKRLDLNFIKIKNEIENNWHIKLPESYKVFKHNNCIPCVRGGISHWYNVWKYYPDRFQKSLDYENKFGHTFLKNILLLDLMKDWKNQINMNFVNDDIDITPCECSI